MIQLQMLNKILQTTEVNLIVENDLNESYFSEYVSEYRFIKAHIDTYGKIPDAETFLSAFPNFDYFKVTESKEFLLKSLYEEFNKRNLATTFNNIRICLQEDRTDDAIKLLNSAVSKIQNKTVQKPVDILKDYSRYSTYIEKTRDFGKFYIKTGFRELDALIGGWDRFEEYATIAARTGVGKSWCLEKTALAAAEQGLNVGLFSGEMSETKVGYRIDTLISHISNSGIMHGSSYLQNDYKRYIDDLENRIKGSIKVLTPAMLQGECGVSDLRNFIENEKLDVLCVDQHSLLKDDRGAKNPVDRAANISKDLKNLQVLKRIPIITVCQQNRSSVEDGVSTAHIAQSDRIAQDSTIIIFLEQKENILTMNLVKSRDAKNNAKLNYMFDYDKGIFNFIPDEESSSKDEISALKDEYEYEGDSPF